MAAYVIGTVQSVSDPEMFSEYVTLAGPTLEKYRGKIVLGDDRIEVGDGNWSPIGVIVIEFDSMSRLKEWYNSPEYKPLNSKRTSSSDSAVIFVDGS